MYPARAVALTLFVLTITGCAGGIGDYRTPGVDQRIVFGPSPQNSYSGRLVEYDPATFDQLNNRAIEICSQLGGVRSPPTYSYSVPIGWKVHLYQCNGPSMQPQRRAPEPRPAQAPSGIGIDAARSKCAELGFVSGSESFGRCVLQLSR
jgi:hypothetical protein